MPSPASSSATSPLQLDLPPHARDIYVISPSGSIADRSRVQRARKFLQRHGFRLTLDPKALATYQQRFAGDDETRLEAFNRAAASAAPVVMASRGGYGLTRYLERFDFEALAASGKKWLGFSDFTAFHLAMLAKTGATTWGGPALVSHFDAQNPADVDATTLETLADALSDRLELVGFRCDGAPSGFEAEGVLWGGNLSLVCSLLGSTYFPRVDGGILFLEEVNEHPYRVERMMTQLLHTGVLDRQRAIVLGHFTWKQAEGDRYTMKRVWQWLRTQTSTPIITGLPFGHEATTLTLPHGAFVGLAVDRRTCYLVLPHGHGAAPVTPDDVAGADGPPASGNTGAKLPEADNPRSGSPVPDRAGANAAAQRATEPGEKDPGHQNTASTETAPRTLFGASLVPEANSRSHQSWQCWCGQTHD